MKRGPPPHRRFFPLKRPAGAPAPARRRPRDFGEEDEGEARTTRARHEGEADEEDEGEAEEPEEDEGEAEGEAEDAESDSQEDPEENAETETQEETFEADSMSPLSATEAVELLPGWSANFAAVPCQRVEAGAYAAGTAGSVARQECLRCVPKEVASLASGSLEHLQPLAVGLVGAGFAFSSVVLDEVADGLVEKGLEGFRLSVDFVCTAGNPKDARDKKRRFFANALQKQKPEGDRACIFDSLDALRGSRCRCLCHFPGSFSEKNAAERALTEQNSCPAAGPVNLLLASVPLAQLSPKTGMVDRTLAAPTVASYVEATKPELVAFEDSDVAGEEGAETPGQRKAAELLTSMGYVVQKLLADPARWGVPVHRPRAYVIGCLVGAGSTTSLFHGAAARARRFGPAFESALKWWQVDGPSVQEFAEMSSETNKGYISSLLIQEQFRQQQKSPPGWEKSLAAYCGRVGLRMPRIAACDESAAASGPWQRLLPSRKKVLLYLAEKSWGASRRGFVTDLAGAPGNGFCEHGALPALRKDSEASSSSSSSSSVGRRCRRVVVAHAAAQVWVAARGGLRALRFDPDSILI